MLTNEEIKEFNVGISQCISKNIKLFIEYPEIEKEDLRQEALIRLHRFQDQFRGDCALNTYAFTVANNTLKNMVVNANHGYRGNKKRVWYGEDITDAMEDEGMTPHITQMLGGESLEDELIWEENKTILAEYITMLPDGNGKKVMEMYVEDKMFREIAEELDIPIGTAQSWYFKSKQLMIEMRNKPMQTQQIRNTNPQPLANRKKKEKTNVKTNVEMLEGVEFKNTTVHGHVMRMAKIDNRIFVSAHDVAASVGYKRQANSRHVAAVLANSGIGVVRKETFEGVSDHWWDTFALGNFADKSKKNNSVVHSMVKAIRLEMNAWKVPEVKKAEPISDVKQGMKPKINKMTPTEVFFEDESSYTGKITKSVMCRYTISGMGREGVDAGCGISGKKLKVGDEVYGFKLSRTSYRGSIYVLAEYVEMPDEIVGEPKEKKSFFTKLKELFSNG